MNKQLNGGRLIRTGEHQARARFSHQVIRGLGKPSLIECRSASRSLETANESSQRRVICSAENFVRKRVSERCNLARGTTEPVVRHCASEGEPVLDDVQPIHAVCRRFHSSARRECAHRLEIALAAIE